MSGPIEGIPGQLIWEALCEAKTGTSTTLAAATGILKRKVQYHLTGWLRQDHVEIAGKDGQSIIYRPTTASDVAPNAPRSGRIPPISGEAAENLWAAARGLRSFTAGELAAHANVGGVTVSELEADRFCRTLILGKFARLSKHGWRGKHPPRYALYRDTGPAAPIEKTIRVVWDPNAANFAFMPEITS